jgi:hypothetical protein
LKPEESTEPCAVYSTRNHPFTIEEMQQIAGSGRISIESKTDDWTKIRVSWDDCSLEINRNPGEDLSTHLQGMRNYILGSLKENSAKAFDLLLRTYQVKEVIGLVSTPRITEKIEKFIISFANLGKGFIFRGNGFYSSGLEIVFDPATGNVAGDLEYWPDSIERKSQSIKLLKSKGIQTLDSLPPVVSEQEVLFRKPEEIADRIQGLFALASRAATEDGISKKEMMTLLGDDISLLTPSEKKFATALWMSGSDRPKYSWRFEAVWVLLWSLKVFDDLKFPTGICMSTDIIKLLNLSLTDISGFTKIKTLKLRSTQEILDQLDLIYRCNWAVTNARAKKQEIPMILNPDVIYERHYALNWLTNYKGYSWDQVKVET